MLKTETKKLSNIQITFIENKLFNKIPGRQFRSIRERTQLK